MRTVRRHLSWLLRAWLLCQVVALAAPVAMAGTGSVPVDEICTCPGVDHDTCPMHHGTTDAGQSALCGMHSAAAPLDVALLSMAGGAGVMPSAVLLARPVTTALVSLEKSSTIDLVVPHDTPPPRLV